MKKKQENSTNSISGRKKRDSSGKNKNNRLKFFSKSQSLKLKCSLINSDKVSETSVGVGLRRSSRKAAIERRIWSEPRREKNWKIPNKEFNSVAKRGRPKKRRTHGPKVSYKDISKDKTSGLETKSTNDIYSGQFSNENLTDRVENGFHSLCDEKALGPIGSDDENREGTLIIDDDDVASLHGALVNEVVKDYVNKSPNNLDDNSYSNSSCNESNSFNKASTKYDQSLSSYSHFYSKENEFSNCSVLSDNKPLQEDNKKEPFEEESFCTNNMCQSNAFGTQTSLAVETSSDRNKVTPDVNIHTIEKEALDTIRDTDKNQSHQSEGDDDNHVSLSEALAKLIDSEAPGHENEPETVTIHPVSILEDTKSPYKTQIDNKSFTNAISSSFSNSSNEISHASRDLIHFKSNPAENGDKDLVFLSSSRKSKIEETSQYQDDIRNCKKVPPTNNTCKQSDENSRTLSPKHTLPNLIKIGSRSTMKAAAIRTPLKCPVCPMRFCTVRSLLWHFGTHEPSPNNVKNDVLLENLITSWDKPEVPLHLSKGNDEFNSERNSSKCKESPFSLSSKSKFDNSQKPCNPESPSSNNGVNKDFILKVPIPKLSYHQKMEPISESSRCFDHTCLSYAAAPKPSTSPTPCVSILPLPSYTPRTPTPEASFSLTLTTNNANNKGSVNSNSVHSLTSSPTLPPVSSKNHYSFHTTQSNGILSTYSMSNSSLPVKLSENLSEKEKPNSTVKSHVTVIPVEKLDQLRSQLNRGTISSDIFTKTNAIEEGCKQQAVCNNKDGITETLLEDNGLVVINRSLSLRIMNTSSKAINSSLNCSIPDALSGSSCLTILPQSKKDCSKSSGKNHAVTSTPDILTIVPQIKSNKSISKDSPTPSPPQLITAVGKVTADSSHIVNLILVPPKDKSNNLGENELTSDKGRKVDCDVSDVDTSSEIESDEGEMVIDVKEEETTSMDPLSLCAVTMEDEDNENKTILKSCTLQPLPPSIEASHSSNTVASNCSSSSHVEKIDDEKYLKRKYVCEFCNKRFGWSTDLKRHIILHTGERPFKCKWCPITFTRKFLLQNHMKKIHTQFCKWSDLWE